ncbi:MAG: response regulator [Proteobacteria bacterium]|nr:response regulator [Pseudomonadota bacterium]
MPSLTPVSFLLVDDLDENLLSLEALLRRDGLVLLKARSGDEALELLLRHEVALALVDVQMPGLNGFELAELIRGNERTRRIPIIFVTAGTADSQRRFRGYEAGAVDFIQKPIEPDVLRSKADVFFELYRQRQQLAAQRDELMAQAQELKQVDRRKDEFLATLAHELRNPLAPLRHGLDLLRLGPKQDVAGKIQETMDRQLGHLVRLIDDLLDVSRVNQGKITLQKKVVPIEGIVRTAVEASQPVIDAAGHTLTVELPKEALWVDGDSARLAQVFSNLLNNAAKYTPKSGRIGLLVRPEAGNAVIKISDNGIGIPPHKQSEVFQMFAQIENHLDRAQGGLGIGLSLVKQLVTMHGGVVAVESAGTNQGSTFTVRLPMVDRSPLPASPAAAAPGPAATSGLKVLVVDDNLAVTETLAAMLEAIGHESRLVHDGRHALEAAREYRPDVVLLDIGLPGMDGYAVCRAFRQDEQFRDTPIIAQSGWGQNHDKASASDAGFTLHLTKPVPLARLEDVLSQIKPR